MSMLEYGGIIRRELTDIANNPKIEGGVSTVRFGVNNKGVIVSSTLSVSSGVPEIDEAAMEAVKVGRKLTVLPDNLHFEVQNFTLPFRFDGDGQPHPSYDCSRAEQLDEIAICQDVKLSRMERMFARAWKAAKAKNETENIMSFESAAKERINCFNDKICIFDVLKYRIDGNVMPWLDEHRRTLIAQAVGENLALKSLNAVGLSGSFALSVKGVQATLIGVDGLDSNSASARGEIQRDDHVEYCERDPDSLSKPNGGRLIASQCADQSAKSSIKAIFQSSADCRARTVRLWDGMWRLKRIDAEYMRVWINPDGVEVEPSNFSAAVDSHFDLLCPQTNARLRAGVEQVSAMPRPRQTGSDAGTKGTNKPPRFSQYPSGTVLNPPPRDAILDTADKRAYRTRLHEAGRTPVNFASRYTITTWGCGSACIAGGIVDRVTGKTFFLPGTLAITVPTNDDKFNAIAFRPGSRLLIMSGQINDEGPIGMYFYLLDREGFQKIEFISMDGEMTGWSKIMTASRS